MGPWDFGCHNSAVLVSAGEKIVQWIGSSGNRHRKWMKMMGFPPSNIGKFMGFPVIFSLNQSANILVYLKTCISPFSLSPSF